MTNTNLQNENELPQELKEVVDNYRQERIDDGATFAEATDLTIEWLTNLANYIESKK